MRKVVLEWRRGEGKGKKGDGEKVVARDEREYNKEKNETIER